MRTSIVVGAGLLLAWTPASARAKDRPDLTVTLSKAGALPEVATRTNVAFVVTAANVRAVEATGVRIRVTMPAGFTGLSTQPSPGTGYTCTIAGTTVECTTAALAGNSEKSFRISATTPATITGQSQGFTLTAVADPANTVQEAGGNNANNSDNFTVTVVTRADLGVSLTAAGAAIVLTQVAPDIFFVVTVTNTGDRPAANLAMRGTLPKDVAFVRVQDNTLGTCLQNSTASDGSLNVTCTLASLAPGATGRVRILGRVLGSVPDKVQVTFAANVDPLNAVPERNENDNTAFMQTTLRAPADLQITSAQTAASAAPAPSLIVEGPGDINCVNRDIEVSLTVKNNGPYPSPATAVTTTWPAGFSGLSTRGSCFGQCAVPILTPGQTMVVKMAAHVTTFSGVARPTFVVDAAQRAFDPVSGNNQRQQYACGL